MNRFYKSILTFTIISLTSLCLKAPSNREVVDAFKAYFEQVDVDLENKHIEFKNANICSSQMPTPLLSTEGRTKKTEDLETEATSLLFQRWASTLWPTMRPINQAVSEFKDHPRLSLSNRDRIARIKGFADSAFSQRLWIHGDNFPQNFIVGHTILAMGFMLGFSAGALSFLPEMKKRYRAWKNGKKKDSGIAVEEKNKCKKLSRSALIARFAGAGLMIFSILGLFLFRNYSIKKAKELNVDKNVYNFDHSTGVACYPATDDIFYNKTNSFNYLSYIPKAFHGFLSEKVYKSL